jgi:hypothetical protein
MMAAEKLFRARRRAGITLTEILIAIMILGVGMVSLASLFPVGLLRLRDATRYTRSAYLTESAQCDATARALFTAASFANVDFTNAFYNYPLWYSLQNESPLTQDTPAYGSLYIDPMTGTILGATSNYPNGASFLSGGAGLPFAYDPLWRWQTGVYLDPVNLTTPEARFGSGIGFLRGDTSGGGTFASAHGLQRLTNFTYPAIFPQSASVPSIFVSPEDVVLAENAASSTVSPVLPDLNLSFSKGTTANDWRYSWMFTGYQISGTGGSAFDGNIVVFENRPFAIDPVPNAPGPAPPGTLYQAAGETVVEAIFGHSANVPNGGGYAGGADRIVLLRWYASQPDPVVRPGDWIADVTYERNQLVVYNPQNQNQTGRFLTGAPPIGIPNGFNNGEWDNTPAQRCYWYQVTRVTPATEDPYLGATMRSMVVYVDRTLQSRTLLSAPGTPMGADLKAGGLNAALICPYVVNVFQQQFTVR